MLKVIFYMSHDTINAFKKYLKLFQEKGLCRVRGENVVIAQKEIIAVCIRLKEVNALPEETVINVLEGLANCLVPDFTKLFNFYLQMSQATHEEDEKGVTDTLAFIKKHLNKAVDEYHALCTAGKWHVSQGTPRATVIVCWNCGKEGHNCGECDIGY